MKPYETRMVNATFELRAADSERVRIEGYASTFGQPYDVGPFRETVDPAAFNRSLGANPDVRLLVDHGGQPLARTKSGTLTLGTDSVGLHMRADLEPSDPDVQRLVPKMRRGDLDQMSFAFRVPHGGDSWSDDFALRTLRNVDIHGGDVSIVTYPANEHTSVSLRARDLRSAHLAFVDAVVAEIRAGKSVSAANLGRLQKVLNALAAADDHLDAAEAAVAEILGVPDPDNDDQDQQATEAMMGRSAMSTSDINDLPDSDFAYIESGGKKDDEGKTVPRSLRHFPIHDADHVRNALARAPQSPFGDKAMPKILAAAKKFGIDVNQNSRPRALAQRIADSLAL